MHSEFVPLQNWPTRQPWRIIRGTTILLDPDTHKPLDPPDATATQLDRIWTALYTWERRHAGTLIADRANELRKTMVEAEDTARRYLRLADPVPPNQAIAA